MILPIAIHCNGDIFTNAEVREATASDIAKVRKIGENGDVYSAFLAWACATCQSIDDVEDENEIKNILKQSPFETVFAIAIWGMAKTKDVDIVEGSYICPNCGTKVDHTGEFADSIFALGTESTEDYGVDIKLKNPVEIKNSKTGEIIEKIEHINMRYAIMDDLIKAFRKYPDDDAKMQFEVYKNSLMSVNGKDVDTKWRNSFGDLVFQKMKFGTINEVTKELSEYSYGSVECVCMKCKSRWKTKLDLTNFFD